MCAAGSGGYALYAGEHAMYTGSAGGRDQCVGGVETMRPVLWIILHVLELLKAVLYVVGALEAACCSVCQRPRRMCSACPKY